MTTADHLRARLQRLGAEGSVDDALVHALTDEAPWTTVPRAWHHLWWLGSTAPFMGQPALPPYVEFRLALLAHGESAALNLGVTVYQWGRLRFAELLDAAARGGVEPRYVLEAALRRLGRSLRWGVPASSMRELLSAVDDPQALLVDLVSGRRNFGTEVRVLAVRTVMDVDLPRDLLTEALRMAALTADREVRLAAQPLAEPLQGHATWLTSKLKGGAAPRRAAAAEWVGQARVYEARDALLAAARKERTEATLVAQLSALRELGLSASDVFTREELVARMAKAASRGTLPPGYAERELNTLPLPRWPDGTEVPRSLLTDWLKAAHKRKKADPTPVLQVITRGLDRESAAATALALFEHWRARDEEAVDRWGQIAKPDDHGTANRGMLALAAALGDDRLVEPGRRYLDTYYGWRPAQSKAVLTLWAHVEHPRATQALLAVATRFRTRGIKKHAQAEVDALAARRGWSAAELADRTLPDCALDEDGRRTLTYRDAADQETRRFVLAVQPDLTVAVLDGDGRPVKSLPAARVGEEAASVKEAKKALGAAKKQVKEFIKAQTARLQAAMVTQRTWTPELFEVLLAHPVMAQICQRLVWMDAAGRSFRPTEDLSLTDVEDDEVSLEPDEPVRLAHALLLPPDVARAWAAHLGDYEILQPFAQFGRPVWRPDAEQATATAFTELVGERRPGQWLRRRAERLGFELEPSSDGGYVPGFTREYREVALTVRLEVEDLRHPIGEEEVTIGACEVRAGDQRLRLDEIPEVLCSEVHADLLALAED
ncbi:MAG: DUF4132 domain-containing protein [Deltaproteobacteria bacterium]|nr:MAG: DUF4132 domain-containing protein [Deltaproteobacteria bacterium]